MRPISPEGQRRELGILQSVRFVPDSPTTRSTSKKEANSAVTQPAAISFVTTEHFTLQGARASTISESIGRASMFLASLSGGLVALGLMATATHVGTAFYAFGLILLPTLAVLGLLTFQRTLQSGIEDYGYARRIARLRAYYFDTAPELVPYLASVDEPDRLRIQGLTGGRWQTFRTIAGTVGVITAVVAGSAVGLAVAVVSSNSIPAALAGGGCVGLGIGVALMRYLASVSMQRRKQRSLTTPTLMGAGTLCCTDLLATVDSAWNGPIGAPGCCGPITRPG